MWKIIWTQVFWPGLLQTLSVIASMAFFIMGAWAGIMHHEYAQGAFLLLLSYMSRGK
jgi:hypothetical protein